MAVRGGPGGYKDVGGGAPEAVATVQILRRACPEPVEGLRMTPTPRVNPRSGPTGDELDDSAGLALLRIDQF